MNDPLTYTPTSIARSGEREIEITWSDGETTRWSARELRDACPCATCREKRGETGNAAAEPAGPMMSLPVLSTAEAKPMQIEGMRPVGTYAYNIAFSDGHNSGLFTFERLREKSLGPN